MSAYVVMRIAIQDPEKLKAYQQVAPAVIKQYGGKILARGGKVLSLEGPEEARRMVMLEFPDLAAAKAFYRSSEYSDAVELRQGAADFEIIALDGIS